MAFSKSKNSQTGLNKQFGNVIPADEKSNAGPSSSSKTIGVIKGRLTTSKQSITSLNTGVATHRDFDH